MEKNRRERFKSFVHIILNLQTTKIHRDNNTKKNRYKYNNGSEHRIMFAIGMHQLFSIFNSGTLSFFHDIRDRRWPVWPSSCGHHLQDWCHHRQKQQNVTEPRERCQFAKYRYRHTKTLRFVKGHHLIISKYLLKEYSILCDFQNEAMEIWTIFRIWRKPQYNFPYVMTQYL